MKTNNRLAAFIEQRKQDDGYWVESAKLDFSMQIEKRRIKQGISYADLARKLATSSAYISKVFRGDTNLTIESMVKLARATGGRIDLRVVDQEIETNLSAWLGSLHNRKAANSGMVSPNAEVETSIELEKMAA